MAEKMWASWEIYNSKTNVLIKKYKGFPSVDYEVGKGVIHAYFYFKKEGKLIFTYSDGIANVKPYVYFYSIYKGDAEPKYNVGRFAIWDLNKEAIEIVMEGTFYKLIEFHDDIIFKSEDPISKYYIKIIKNTIFYLLV
ncbi:MAG: hypothetical protein HWN67_09195 [Candidatus Helarchaeota archaeon]|nr:hypothetical protein [Candidatus Helarchaeota archaeon]